MNFAQLIVKTDFLFYTFLLFCVFFLALMLLSLVTMTLSNAFKRLLKRSEPCNTVNWSQISKAVQNAIK